MTPLLLLIILEIVTQPRSIDVYMCAGAGVVRPARMA